MILGVIVALVIIKNGVTRPRSEDVACCVSARRRAQWGSLVIRGRLAAVVFLSLWPGLESTSQAQELQTGIRLAVAIPQGEFRRNVSNNWYGVDFGLLVALGPSPVFIGVDAGLAAYGHTTRREPSTIPGGTVAVQTDNNIVMAHFVLRAQPRTGTIRPYVDGLIGLNHLYTRTKIDELRPDGTIQGFADTTNLRDTAFGYGFGGGVQFDLPWQGGRVSLDTRVLYLLGGRADYLKKGSIRLTGHTASFDKLSSRTDLIAAQAGVTIHFRTCPESGGKRKMA